MKWHKSSNVVFMSFFIQDNTNENYKRANKIFATDSEPVCLFFIFNFSLKIKL
jgi:hypothetical protein